MRAKERQYNASVQPFYDFRPKCTGKYCKGGRLQLLTLPLNGRFPAVSRRVAAQQGGDHEEGRLRAGETRERATSGAEQDRSPAKFGKGVSLHACYLTYLRGDE